MLERLARRLLMTSSYLDPKLKAAGEKFSFRGLAGFEEDSSNKKKKAKKALLNFSWATFIELDVHVRVHVQPWANML
jgi:hypothetical protein